MRLFPSTKMIEDQGKSERGGLFFKSRVQLDAIKRGARLRDRGFEGAQVANRKRAAANGDDACVQFEDFGDRKKARHRRAGLRETTIQLGILFNDMLRRGIKRRFLANEQIAQRGRHQRFGRDVKSVGQVSEVLALRFGDFEGKTHLPKIV